MGELLLVGSIPLDTPEQVFATFGAPLGKFLLAMPDGEVGPRRHWVSRVVYAYAASLFNMHDQVSQGAAHCAMTPAVMRRLGSRDPMEMCAIAKALGVWKQGDPVAEAPLRAAEELEKVFASIGMPTNLSQLDIPKSSAEQILASSLKNFNADPKQEFVKEKELLREVLNATW